jgi:hypothetical protein
MELRAFEFMLRGGWIMANGHQTSKRMRPGWLYLVGILALLVVLIPQKTVQASASSCQCVDYVKNRFHLTGRSRSAKDFASYLKANGFTQVSSPQVGAVAVQQPAFGQGVSTLGHVSVITAVSSVGKYWQITTIGANQARKKTTQYNCSNVGVVLWGKYPKSWGADKITYWAPPK